MFRLQENMFTTTAGIVVAQYNIVIDLGEKVTTKQILCYTRNGVKNWKMLRGGVQQSELGEKASIGFSKYDEAESILRMSWSTNRGQLSFARKN